MLPPILVPALIGLGGVCLIGTIYIFSHFREKVEVQVTDRMNQIFASNQVSELFEEAKKGEVPNIVLKDFYKQIFRVQEPRRRLSSLLLFFPVVGSLFIFSAIFGSVTEIENEFIASIGGVIEFSADSVLLVASILFAYCIIQLIRLCRRLT